MKIPVEFRRTDDGPHFKAVISLQDAITRNSIDTELIRIQSDYAIFIEKCIKIQNKITGSRKNKGDPVLRWKLADRIYNFAKTLEENGFLFANLTEALSRDLKISVRPVNYLIDFRTTYPRIELINKQIKWDTYRELLDVSDLSLRNEFEKKIISGELKSRADIRNFKKQIRK
jgi:hypothetical protein